MSEINDLVFNADRFQGTDHAYRCRNPRHPDAKLWPHKSGSVLMCVERDCNEALGLTPQILIAPE